MEVKVIRPRAVGAPWLPPRWFIRFAWKVQRPLFRVSGGRRGLWPAREGRWGGMWLTAVRRRTGRERSVILGYFEDGPDLVTLAMNGWGRGVGLVAQPAGPSTCTGPAGGRDARRRRACRGRV